VDPDHGELLAMLSFDGEMRPRIRTEVDLDDLAALRGRQGHPLGLGRRAPPAVDEHERGGGREDGHGDAGPAEGQEPEAGALGLRLALDGPLDAGEERVALRIGEGAGALVGELLQDLDVLLGLRLDAHDFTSCVVTPSKYSSSAACILRRAWKSRLMMVPLGTSSMLAISS